MKYTINEKKKTFTLHEADTSVSELTKLLEKYKGYRIHVNINLGGGPHIVTVTDAGYDNKYYPDANPYEITSTEKLTECDCSKNGAICDCPQGPIKTREII